MNLLILIMLTSLLHAENLPIIDGNISEGEWNESYREIVFLNQFQPEYGPAIED